MRIVGNMPSAAPQNTAAAGHEILNELAPGDALEAEVVSAADEKLALRLPDGTRVNAQRLAQGSLPQGARLAFTVLSKAGGMLTVELTDPSLGTKGINTDALLKAFGAEATPEGRELIREMVKNGITPSKQAFSTLTNMLNAHPALTPKQAAFMLGQKMPVNEQSVEDFQEFLGKGSQIGAKLTELLDVLEDGARPQKPVTDTALVRGQTPSAREVSPGLPGRAETAVLPGRAENAAWPELTLTSAQEAAAGRESAGLVRETSRAMLNEAELPAFLRERTAVAGEKPTVSEGGPDLLQTPEQSGQPLRAARQQAAAHLPAERPETDNPNAPPVRQSGAGEDMPLPVADRPVNAARQAGQQADDSMMLVQKPSEDALARKTGDIKEMIRSLFREIDPERADTLPKELSAQRFLQELDEVVKVCREKSSELSPEVRRAVGAAVQDIQQSMHFLDQLNRYTAMVQIPVMINQERSTAELYVFHDGRKGAKRIDPQNATLFLSLRTSHMGRVEAFIKVIGKNIECDFRLEDEPEIGLLRGNAQDLSKMLEAHGYHLARLSAQLTQKPADLFAVRDERDQNRAKYFFDAKV